VTEDVPRHNASTNDDESAASVDEPVLDEDADESADIEPVPEKIGEGVTNLRDRNAALGRRRGDERPAP
jgi:hypothetical protein